MASKQKDAKPSRKSKVRELWAKEGADVAGLRAKLAEGTLRSWFYTWRRDQQKSNPKPKSKSKTTAKAKPAKVTAAPETQPVPVAA